MKRPLAPVPTGSVTVPARLFAALLEIARGRLTTVSPGKQQHVAGLISQEHWGICNTRYWREGCGPTCTQIRATIDEAAGLWAATEAEQPHQMELIA